MRIILQSDATPYKSLLKLTRENKKYSKFNMTHLINPFHLAIPVKNLQQSKSFYQKLLGCQLGRSSNKWQDLNFFGHQLVLHEVKDLKISDTNPVDGHNVPIPHFGVVLTIELWKTLKNRLMQANIKFEIEPYIRFEGQVGEQATMFFFDPSGNALEFKAFADIEYELFKT